MNDTNPNSPKHEGTAYTGKLPKEEGAAGWMYTLEIQEWTTSVPWQ